MSVPKKRLTTFTTAKSTGEKFKKAAPMVNSKVGITMSEVAGFSVAGQVRLKSFSGRQDQYREVLMGEDG